MANNANVNGTALHTQTRTMPRTNPESARDGSRTITETPSEAAASRSPSPTVAGTLRLRGGPTSSRRVQWTEDVVDNEHLGRKSSKICCIYHKPRAFGESDSDESDSSASDGEAHDNNDPNFMHGKGCKHKKHQRGSSPNAYERQPKHNSNKKGKEAA